MHEYFQRISAATQHVRVSLWLTWTLIQKTDSDADSAAGGFDAVCLTCDHGCMGLDTFTNKHLAGFGVAQRQSSGGSVRRLLASLAIVVALLTGVSWAMMPFQVELTCPIGGEQFSQMLVTSGTSYGVHLDTRPVGPMPAPWPIAKCPKNGFVLFKEEFTPEELQKLLPIVQSRQYQDLSKSETNYFLAAYLAEKLGYSMRGVAYLFIQASWEAGDQEKEQRYLSRALMLYKRALDADYDDDGAWMQDQMLAGELERRLTMFTSARARFEGLVANGRVGQGIYRQIAKQQLELITRMDSGSHQIEPAKH